MTLKKPRPEATSAEVAKPPAKPAAALRSKSEPAVKAPAKPSQPTASRDPVQYRYQLAQYVAERRPDGWYTAKAWSVSQGEKPKWEGPFAFPEDAAIAIARNLCSELSNRHMSKARFYNVKVGQPLYGLPTPPALLSPKKRGGAT